MERKGSHEVVKKKTYDNLGAAYRLSGASVVYGVT